MVVNKLLIKKQSLFYRKIFRSD